MSRLSALINRHQSKSLSRSSRDAIASSPSLSLCLAEDVIRVASTSGPTVISAKDPVGGFTEGALTHSPFRKRWCSLRVASACRVVARIIRGERRQFSSLPQPLLPALHVPWPSPPPHSTISVRQPIVLHGEVFARVHTLIHTRRRRLHGRTCCASFHSPNHGLDKLAAHKNSYCVRARAILCICARRPRAGFVQKPTAVPLRKSRNACSWGRVAVTSQKVRVKTTIPPYRTFWYMSECHPSSRHVDTSEAGRLLRARWIRPRETSPVNTTVSCYDLYLKGDRVAFGIRKGDRLYRARFWTQLIVITNNQSFIDPIAPRFQGLTLGFGAQFLFFPVRNVYPADLDVDGVTSHTVIYSEILIMHLQGSVVVYPETALWFHRYPPIPFSLSFSLSPSLSDITTLSWSIRPDHSLGSIQLFISKNISPSFASPFSLSRSWSEGRLWTTTITQTRVLSVTHLAHLEKSVSPVYITEKIHTRLRRRRRRGSRGTSSDRRIDPNG